MSNATAKIVRQSTGPEMSDYIESEIYNLCEAIQDKGTPLKSGGLAQIRFIELFRVSYILFRVESTPEIGVKKVKMLFFHFDTNLCVIIQQYNTIQ